MFLIMLVISKVKCKKKTNPTECWKHLREYIEIKSKVYQVMIMTNKTNINNEILDFMQNTPALKMSFQSTKKKELQILPIFQKVKNPKTTTLFVIDTEDLNDIKKLKDAIDLISSASYSKGHPKCLFLIHSNQRNLKFDQFLRDIWKKRFLDVTVLHIAVVNTLIPFDDENQKRNKLSDMLATENQIDKIFPKIGIIKNQRSAKIQIFATLHRFNPYFNKYTKRKCSSQIELFPDKLHNLNAYEIRSGIFHRPPTSFAKVNSTGFPIEFQGINFNVAKILSYAMNFNLSFVQERQIRFGRFDCHNKSLTSGYNYKVLNHEIQFIAVSSVVIPNCLFDYASFNLGKIVVLVPIIKTNDIVIQRKSLLYLTFAVSTLAALSLILIWIFIRILKFDFRYWKLMYIIQVVLQLNAAREPRGTRERMIFCYILIMCAMYSSRIFGTLTSLQFTTQDELPFNTIDDVYKSDLQPICKEIHKTLLLPSANSNVKKFMDKHIIYNDMIPVCLGFIVKYKNVSCTMMLPRRK